MGHSIEYDRKNDCFKAIKSITESIGAEEIYVVDHAHDIPKIFRYKPTPVGVLKSGYLFFNRTDHPEESKEISVMRNYKVNDLLYWKQ